MLDLINYSHFEQLRNFAVKFGGQYEEDLDVARFSIQNEIGKGSINTFVIFPGFVVTSVDIFLNRDLNLLDQLMNNSDLNFAYCLEGYYYHSLGPGNKGKIIKSNYNIIFHSSPETENLVRIPIGVSLKVLFITLTKDQIDKTKFISNYNLPHQLSELFKLVDSQFFINNYILPETQLHKLANQLLQIDTIDNVSKLLTRGLGLLILSQQVDNLYSAQVVHSDFKNIRKEEFNAFLSTFQYVEKNLSHKLTIEDFSKQSGLSRNKLQLICNQYFNVTFKRLIKDLRLEKARYLMQTTEYSISDICYDIGYNSRSFFSKEFKSAYGLNPLDYKNELENEGLVFELSYYTKLHNKINEDELKVFSKAFPDIQERLNITGVLLLHNDNFFHIIEGTKTNVLSYYQELLNDSNYYKTTEIFKGYRSTQRFNCHNFLIVDNSTRNEFNIKAHFILLDFNSIMNSLKSLQMASHLLWKRVHSILLADLSDK